VNIRAFLRDAVTYAVPTLLSRGMALLLLPFYARYLGPAQYGTVELLTLVYVLLNLVLPLEVSQAVARFSPEAPDSQQKARYVSTAVSFTALVFGGLVLVAAFAPLGARSAVLGSAAAAEVMPLASVWMAVNALFYILLNQLRWDRQAAMYARTSVAFAVVSAGTSVLLIAGLGLGIRGYLWGQLAGCAAGMLIALHGLRATTRVMPRLDTAELKRMLSFSSPLVISSMAVYLTLYVDRWLLFGWRGGEELGIYAVGYRIASIVTLAVAGVQLALTPMIYAHYRDPATPQALRKIMRYFLLGSSLFVLLISAFAAEIVSVVAGREYASAGNVVGWLCLGTVLANLYLFAPGLILAKRTRTIALLGIASATANVVVSLVFIPQVGALGAALGMLSGSAASAALYLSLGERHYRISYEWRRYAIMLLMVPAMLLLQNPDLAWRIVVLAAASAAITCTLLERRDFQRLRNPVGGMGSH
jgi:O-antigen/teichoic acid export membrane protein